MTIPNGQQNSNILAARELGMSESVVFYTPAAFTGTISVQVAATEDATAGVMVPLYNEGTAVTLGAARAEKRSVQGAEAIRVASSTNEAADRVIDVYAILDI